MTQSSLTQIKENLFLLVKIGLFFTFIALALYIYKFSGSKLSNNPSDWADFGSYIGGVLGPFFAFLSLIAVLLTIIYQRAAQEKQDQALYKQNFEASFFQMLRLYNEIVDDIKIDTDQGTIGAEITGFEGRRALAELLNDFNRFLTLKKIMSDPHSSIVKNVTGHYLDFYSDRENADQLGHYFRNLYTIIKFIDNSLLDENDKIINRKKYTSIVRAQLSNSEQLLLLYNCLGKYGVEKFYPLINKYAFFENLDVSKAIPDIIVAAYEPSAFGDQMSTNKKLKEIFESVHLKFRADVDLEIRSLKRIKDAK